jgi:hypothetical protein
MRDYRATLRRTKGNAERRAHQQGAEAMREAAIELFRGIGVREMSGYVAMDLVKGITLPQSRPLRAD